MTGRRRGLPLLFCGFAISACHTGPPAELHSTAGVPRPVVQGTPSWSTPAISPCDLLEIRIVESAIGPLNEPPRNAGSIMDGMSCMYVGAEGIIVSVGLISSVTFQSRKSDSGIYLDDFADQAFAIRPNSLDTLVLAHREDYSVAIMTTRSGDVLADKSLQVAMLLADSVLERLVQLRIPRT